MTPPAHEPQATERNLKRSGHHDNASSLVEEQGESLLSRDPNASTSAPLASSGSSVTSHRHHPPTSEHEEEDGLAGYPSRKLRHHFLVVCLTLAYGATAIVSWSIICVLVYRPLTARHYGLWLREDDIDGSSYPSRRAYANNEWWFQAARFLQAIVAIATIPLTSALCSSAAVIFVQRRCKYRDLTPRQTTVLADKGWTDFEVYGQLLRGRWKQYGSRLLFIAIALNPLGSAISPLQSLFTTTVTVHTPSTLSTIRGLTDFSDREGNVAGANDTTAGSTLRPLLTAVTRADPQVRLWTRFGAVNCSKPSSTSQSACVIGQALLSNMSSIEDPFVAQLPAGYSTGLIRQFLPRINSSVSRVKIDAADFPANCDDGIGLFLNQSNQTAGSWSLIACMPGVQPQRPTNAVVEQAQDTLEQLFLNISTASPPSGDADDPVRRGGYFEITMRTTSGYFELPNYMNKQVPGPPISGNPNKHCGRDCVAQGNKPVIFDHNNTLSPTGNSIGPPSNETDGNASIASSLLPVPAIFNKGPLLTIALALIGAGSFLTDGAEQPDNNVIQGQNGQVGKCTEHLPLSDFLAPSYPIASSDDNTHVNLCMNDGQWNYGETQSVIMSYLQMFISESRNTTRPMGPAVEHAYNRGLEDAFEAAAFLANEQWLTTDHQASFSVSYDHGIGIQAPCIPEHGIILLSILLGLYLIAMLAMALYSNMSPRWTDTLDSLAIMQYGAAIAERLPLKLVVDRHKLEVLDDTPGWIGDASGGKGKVGELGLRAAVPLLSGREYRCYEDEEQSEKIGTHRWSVHWLHRAKRKI